MGLAIVGQADQNIIQFTATALTQMKEIMAKDETPNILGVRVAIAGGGCSGFMYDIFIENEVDEDDKVIEYDGIKFFIDKASLPYLKGVEVDYTSSMLESGFKFSNPNATKSCGCGTSFSVG